MIWFEYKYIEVEKVIADVRVLSDFSFIEQIIFFWSVIWVIFLVQYILPFIYIINKYRKEENEKTRRRLFLQQIILQKDIESEIEKEIENEEDEIEKWIY